jgi:hypothetical protein
MRRLAFWLLFAPIPDPELKLELMGWAMVLLMLADALAWCCLFIRGIL